MGHPERLFELAMGSSARVKPVPSGTRWALALLITCGVTIPGRMAAATPVDIRDGDWQVALGLVFPGAAGNAWLAGGEEGPRLVLQGDFRRGGAYVGWTRKFKAEPEVKRISFSLRTRDVSFLIFRATDSTGQTFQQKLTLADGADWQTITVVDFPGAKNHGNSWGGKKDGTWHGPLASISLLVDKGSLKPTGEAMGKVELRELTVE